MNRQKLRGMDLELRGISDICKDPKVIITVIVKNTNFVIHVIKENPTVPKLKVLARTNV